VKATDDDTPVRPAAAVAQPNVSTPDASTPTTAAPGGGTVPPAVSGNGTTFDIQAVLFEDPRVPRDQINQKSEAHGRYGDADFLPFLRI
jgi:hypothetical protein